MSDNKSQVFSGRINTVTYDDGASFRIVKISLDDSGGQVTAKGHFAGQNIVPGTWVCFEGHYTVHPTYGRQIAVERSPVVPEHWTNDRVLSIVSAQGIGPGVRVNLIAHAGSRSLLTVLDGNDLPPDLAYVGERWKAAKAHLYAAAFLAQAGVPNAVIERVWKKYSTDVENIVTKDPWALVQVDGVTFAQADEIARKLGVPMDSPNRMGGAVLATINNTASEGHLYSTMSDILSNVLTLIPNANDSSVAQAVKDLVRSNALILDRNTKAGTVALYDPAIYDLEQYCATTLVDRSRVKPSVDCSPLFARVGPQAQAAVESGSDHKAVVNAALADWSTGSGITLTEDQLKAALSALTDNVCLITGLPGTGKTTALRAVVTLLKDTGISFLLVAPTGIAAKRLSNVVNAPAFTIHRAFGAKGKYGESDDREVAYEGFLGDTDTKKTASSPTDETWGYGPGNPHPANVVIVDETSMVDLNMLHRVLSGTKADCRMVFVGDPYQLPSVGAGDVLGDLVESKSFPHTHLDRIFRQEDTNGIVLAAHAVHKGKTPESDGRDFVIVPASTETEASEIILRLTQTLYEKRSNFQVLSPRHSGDAGVTILNDRIRAQLNPPMSGMSETKVGSSVVREGDRIMVVKNDYQKGVYNGDVGTVRRIDRVAKEIEANVFGVPGTPSALVRFPMSDAAKTLRLAYAQTVHKCVHPSTVIWHDGGLCQIKHLPESGKVGTPDGVRDYINKTEYPSSPLLRVKTESGYTLYMTPEHGIDVWDRASGQYVRKEAQELKASDWLYLVPSPSYPDNKDLLPLEPIKFGKKAYPPFLDESIAEMIGIFSAFSRVRHRALSVNLHPVARNQISAHGRSDIGPILDKINNVFHKCFGRYPGTTRTGDRPHLIRVYLKFIMGWFWKNFPELYRSRGYEIPRLILASNKSVRRAFLRGYFLSAMTKYENPEDVDSPIECIWVRSRNESSDAALRAMLLDEGVIARCSVKNNITIRGRDLDRFFNRIGFDHPDANRLRTRPRLDFPDDSRVPITTDEARVIYQHGASRSAPTVLALQHLPALSARTRFHHEKVVSITSAYGPSMCVEVPDTHKFIQNGFSGWNSQGQEYDVIVLPLLSTFGRQLQRNLLYTAITRARKKVLIVGQASAVTKAVQNDAAEHRKTLLAFRISGAMGGGETPQGV